MRPSLAHWLEAWAVRGALALLRGLSPVAASNLGGALARAIGPRLPVSRVADANLRLALPELDEAARRRIVRGVWDNLGRTVAEMPHVARLRRGAGGPDLEVEGVAHLLRAAEAGGPAIMFSGHLANWELLVAAPASYGVPMGVFYRAPGNPLVDEIVVRLRREGVGAPVPMFAKGAQGARAAMAFLKGGGMLGMLVDQKMNDGIAATLFGHKAMTAPAAAAFALRYRCPLIPVRAERLGPARFRITVEPPLAFPDTGDRHADIAALTATMNAHLERWIRARPQDWLWLHRRWPKELYA